MEIHHVNKLQNDFVAHLATNLGSVTNQEKDVSFFRQDESRCCEADSRIFLDQ